MASRAEAARRREQVTRLRHEGLTIRQIADRLGVPAGTVASDVARTREVRPENAGRRALLTRLLCELTASQRRALGRVLLEDRWRQPDSTGATRGFR